MLKHWLFSHLFKSKEKPSPAPAAVLQPDPVPDASPAAAVPTGKHPAQEREALLCLIQHGQLTLPEGMEQLCHGFFEGCSQIESVVVPGTVKTIHSRAFAKCVNLKNVILHEGVEVLDSNVFNGCTRLASIELPQSIRSVSGWTFFGSGLTQPVFSRDGRMLVYYPQTSEASEYTVPDGVEAIGSRAFINVHCLTSVRLPDSLKHIEEMAFIDCGFEKISLPEHTEVERGAFRHFKSILRIHRPGTRSVLEEHVELCRCMDIPLLQARRMNAPAQAYWRETDFQLLSGRCAQGDADAMDEMRQFFALKAKSDPNEVFYPCAEQFWLVRAYQYGSQSAQNELSRRLSRPDRCMASPCISEELRGSGFGAALKALGFPFFEEEREYSLAGMDEDGVVEVSSYESEDGPDEDGFGREEYYDWWYLDAFLALPQGVQMIHSYSHNDKRCNQTFFAQMRSTAAQSSRRPSV